jgi:disulfide oxidoreductase YuzD
MSFNQVEITVYGAEERCPSCVNAPSSKETFEWLQAAVSRKFPGQPFTIHFVNIHEPVSTQDKDFSNRIKEEDLFYPLVVIGGEIVAEGNPRLKVIYNEMERYGYREKGPASNP